MSLKLNEWITFRIRYLRFQRKCECRSAQAITLLVVVVVVVVAGSADCDVTVFRWEAGADGEDRRLWCAARMEQQRSQEH